MLAAIVLVALHLLTTTEAVNFYKCPAEAKESPIIGDDTASGPINITSSIPFYGGYYNTAYVSCATLIHEPSSRSCITSISSYIPLFYRLAAME